MARLYANENFPFTVVVALRALGHDVLTTLDAGQAGQAIPDEAVLDFAAREGRAILTLNRRHFIRLHQLRPGHARMIVCTYDPDATGQAGRIDQATRQSSDLPGRLLRINRPSP
ncbi:MAG: DUF5615 family PIN-like protein [Candidatus Xenobia bacterium]